MLFLEADRLLSCYLCTPGFEFVSLVVIVRFSTYYEHIQQTRPSWVKRETLILQSTTLKYEKY